MTPAKIKKIREKLNLTQDELATILGVTKMTVWRYEGGRATPSDETSVKLANLAASLENPAERKHLKDLRKTPGGVAAITAVAAMGAAIFSGAAAAGAAAAGCASVVATPAGLSLLSFLQTFLGRRTDDQAPDCGSALGALGLCAGSIGAIGAISGAALGKPAIPKGEPAPEKSRENEPAAQVAGGGQDSSNYEI